MSNIVWSLVKKIFRVRFIISSHTYRIVNVNNQPLEYLEEHDGLVFVFESIWLMDNQALY